MVGFGFSLPVVAAWWQLYTLPMTIIVNLRHKIGKHFGDPAEVAA